LAACASFEKANDVDDCMGSPEKELYPLVAALGIGMLFQVRVD
jgi:hypothetical protein